MKLKGFAAASCLFALFALAPTVTRADNLVVTGGTVVVTGTFTDSHDSVTLIGVNFSVAGGGVTVFANTDCQPCHQGSTVNFGNNFPGTFPHDSTDGVSYGAFTLAGTTYDDPDIRSVVSFIITAPATLIVPAGNPAQFTFSVPFTMSGSYLIRNIATFQTVSSGTVTGQGIADIVLVRNIDPLPDGTFLYEAHSATYRFSATTVPEPTALTLLGAGTAGLYLRLRKKRRG
jgi:hypothetical protein